MKKCSKCNEVKPLENFYKGKNYKDGHIGQCKSCKDIIKKDYKEKNQEKFKAYNISNNRKEYSKKYYIENKENILIKSKDYYENNKELVKKNSKKYIYKKRKDDNLFRLKESISKILRRSFLSKVEDKNIIIGISLIDLKIYLESKFEPWMNWENYGKYNGEFNYGWDIDHILPLSISTTEDEIIKLNHYTNLQPLCSKINRDIKKDKLTYEI